MIGQQIAAQLSDKWLVDKVVSRSMMQLNLDGRLGIWGAQTIPPGLYWHRIGKSSASSVSFEKDGYVFRVQSMRRRRLSLLRVIAQNHR